MVSLSPLRDYKRRSRLLLILCFLFTLLLLYPSPPSSDSDSIPLDIPITQDDEDTTTTTTATATGVYSESVKEPTRGSTKSPSVSDHHVPSFSAGDALATASQWTHASVKALSRFRDAWDHASSREALYSFRDRSWVREGRGIPNVRQDGGGWECTGIPMMREVHSQWHSIEQCSLPKHCLHYLVLKRAYCPIVKLPLERPIAEASSVQVNMLSSFGPDSIEAILVGPQKYVVDPGNIEFDPETCTYYLKVELQRSGKYALSVLHTFDKYWGIQEAVHYGPIPVVDKWLLKDHSLELCGSLKEEPEYRHLPLCSASEAITGTWLPSGETPMEKMANQFAFQEGGPHYTWTPIGCRYGPYVSAHLEETKECRMHYHHKHVLFIGDSHIRGLMQSVMRRLYNDRRQHKFGHAYVRDVEIGPYRLQQLWDPFLMELAHKPYEYFDSLDAVYFGTGHWGAAGVFHGGQWTLAHFTQVFDAATDALVRIRAKRRELDLERPLHLIFQGITAPPRLRSIEYWNATLDWRTPTRLWMWNKVALEIAARKNITVVDAWSMTHASADMASWHFDHRDAYQALVTEAMHRMDFCSTRRSALARHLVQFVTEKSVDVQDFVEEGGSVAILN